MSEIIDDAFLDKYLENHFDEFKIDLLKGKSGFAIYYAIYGHESKAKEALCERLIDSLCKASNDTTSFTDGGGIFDIALSIGYIVRKLQNGDADVALANVDALLYKRYCISQNKGNLPSNYIDALFYMSQHLKFDVKDKTKRNILEREIMFWIEHIYTMADKDADFYEDPVFFNLLNKQILFFESLLCIYEQGIYTVRIEHIFNELLYKVCKLPVLYSNRLQLLYIVQKLCLTVKNIKSEWSEYLDILRANISIDKILNEEMTKDQIFFSDGISGVYLLMILYNKLIGENYFKIDSKLYCDRIYNSVFTKRLSKKVAQQGLGLNGFWGIKILLGYLSKSEPETTR